MQRRGMGEKGAICCSLDKETGLQEDSALLSALIAAVGSEGLVEEALKQMHPT
jgi:hypothetical protein